MPDMPDAIVLCGGAGLRLRSVTGDAPKSTAAIAGRPFLELLFRQLQRHGFRRAILAVGYQHEVIRSYFGPSACGLQLTYSVEHTPMGTGGALRNALESIHSDSALVTNGDSYTNADLKEFVSNYQRQQADASMIVVPVDGRDDAGSVVLNEAREIVRFEEKRANSDARYLNAGIYMVSRQMLSGIAPDRKISLEVELFPGWLNQGKTITGFVCSEPCIDIGTPERYLNAQTVLAGLEPAFEQSRD
jgi:NDP-sugar pyrophosphorylase family protein